METRKGVYRKEVSSIYTQDKNWKAVQPYLPRENRLTEENLPEEYFETLENGFEIHVDHYIPERATARIILFHGVGGNGRLLSCIAIPLVKNGYEVLCPDLPLYGYSRYRGTVTYAHWVYCAVEFAKRVQKDGLPLFLFGLSAGGMLAYQAACELEHVSGLMASCILDQRIAEVTRETAANPFVGTAGLKLVHWLHRPLGPVRLPMKLVANMKKIANDPGLADLLMRDRRSSGARVPLAFLHSMLQPDIRVEPERFTSCPFLLVHPEKDLWTDVRLSRLFFDRLACEKTICMLPGAGHFPVEQKGLATLAQASVSFISKHLN